MIDEQVISLTVNGKVMENTFFSNHLLREAVEINNEGRA